MELETKRRARRVLLGATCIAIAATASAEIALRRIGFYAPNASQPAVLWSRGEDRALFGSAGLHRFDAQSLWSPRPGAEIAPDERVNSDGYRGPLLARAKTPGVVRVALLGDATTFGRGVSYTDTFAARLVIELASRGVRAETLDAGVIGSTLVQGVGRWDALVAQFAPDVVVCGYSGASEALPAIGASDGEKVDALNAGLAPRVVQLARWLPRAASGAAWRELDLELRRESELRESFASGGARPRVSLAEFGESLAALASRIAASGAHGIALVPPRAATNATLDAYRDALRRFGETPVELAPPRSEWFERVESGGGTRTELSPTGHGAVAAALADAIARIAQH